MREQLHVGSLRIAVPDPDVAVTLNQRIKAPSPGKRCEYQLFLGQMRMKLGSHRAPVVPPQVIGLGMNDPANGSRTQVAAMGHREPGVTQVVVDRRPVTPHFARDRIGGGRHGMHGGNSCAQTTALTGIRRGWRNPRSSRDEACNKAATAAPSIRLFTWNGACLRRRAARQRNGALRCTCSCTKPRQHKLVVPRRLAPVAIISVTSGNSSSLSKSTRTVPPLKWTAVRTIKG